MKERIVSYYVFRRLPRRLPGRRRIASLAACGPARPVARWVFDRRTAVWTEPQDEPRPMPTVH